MDELIIYMLKVSVCISMLYGFYLISLKRETHFHFNRAYLLLSVIVSLILPLLNIHYFSGNSDKDFAVMLQVIQVSSHKVFAENINHPIYYFKMIYLAGIVVLSVRFITKIISLVRIRRHCWIEKNNGQIIALSKKEIAPFSFFRTIFINDKMRNNEQLRNIIIHETIHIRQLHSLDIILTEIFCLLTWFNPVSWKIKAALKETHEYLADSGVSEQMPDYAEYFLLLTRYITGLQPGLANNFNNSLTLKRLKMMKKSRSGRLSLMKALPVLPVLILLFIVFSCKHSTDVMNSQNSSASQKDGKTSVLADKMPQFSGGQDALTKFIIENVKYPEAAKKNGIQGKVLVTFHISKTGKPENIKVSQSVNELLDAEAIRVISIMPLWIPGESKGSPVDVEITLPIQFKLS